MKKIILLFSLSILSVFAFAQKKEKFRLGIQSGINISKAQIYLNDVNQELFLGSSFGIVGRQFLIPFKLHWAHLKLKNHLYLDFGLNAIRNGYVYDFADNNVITDIYSFEAPLIFVIKSFDSITHRRATKKMVKKKLFYITKCGLVLSKQASRTFTRTINDNNANQRIVETGALSNKLNVAFMSGFGIQKEMKNGAINYFGISFHQSLRPSVEGTIEIIKNGQTKADTYHALSSYFSIDLQHFFGKPYKPTKQDKVIIFNPRFM